MVAEKVVIEIILCVFDFLAFLGFILNICVIFVIIREKKVQRKSNWYILSVACCDLLVGLVVIPIGTWIVKYYLYIFELFWMIHSTGCNRKSTKPSLVLGFFSFMLAVFTVSIFSLVAISVDRFIAVCYPLIYHVKCTTKSTGITICLCWLSGIMGFLPVLGWNSGISGDSCDPRIVMDFNFVIFLCVFASFIPTIIIVVLYTMIFRRIIKQVWKRNTPNMNRELILIQFRTEKDLQWSQSPTPKKNLKLPKYCRWLLQAFWFVGFRFRYHFSFLL